MKKTILLASLAMSVSACASTKPVPPAMPEPTPVVSKPAPPPPAVDCTGLSEAECLYQIENYGNPNPPPMRGPLDIDPVPVEPVDVEPMGEIRG